MLKRLDHITSLSPINNEVKGLVILAYSNCVFSHLATTI